MVERWVVVWAAVPWVVDHLLRSSAIVSRRAPINHSRAHAQDSGNQCNHGQLLCLGTSRERLVVRLTTNPQPNPI